MANEDPDSIPEQVRNNRPFVIALLLGLVIAVGTFLWVIATPKPDQLERSVIPDPNSPTGEATPNTGYLGTETPPATASDAPAGTAAPTAPAASDAAPATTTPATPAPAAPAPAASDAAPAPTAPAPETPAPATPAPATTQ